MYNGSSPSSYGGLERNAYPPFADDEEAGYGFASNPRASADGARPNP
jgi:hypothetical protein